MALRALQGPTGGGTPVGGTGTTNTIPRWNPGPSTLGDSRATDDGTTFVVGSGAYAGTALPGGMQLKTTVPIYVATDGTRTTIVGTDGTTSCFVGSLTNHNFQIRANNAIAITVQPGGNVGIGTPAPVGRADVAGTSVNQLAWGLLSVRSNDAQGADKGGSIAFGGIYDASNTTHWAQISGRKENGTSGQYGGYLAFATRTDGAGTNTERARIDSAGNFGIGTASPLGYANFVALNIGDNNAAKTGLLKFRSTYNAGNGAELYQATDGRVILNADGTGTTAAILDPTNKLLNIAPASGWGLKLPATPGNADTQTLDCYAEVAWTPADVSGAGLAITVNRATYTKIGRTVTASFDITYPVTANGTAAQISLPESTGTANLGTLSAPYCSVALAAGLTGIVTNGKIVFYYGYPSANVPNSTFSGARIVASVTFTV